MAKRGDGLSRPPADPSASEVHVATDSRHQQETARFTPRTIGIYGSRAAGKTCYLSVALLGMSASDRCSVVLSDDSSRDVLQLHWEAIKEGNLPPATALTLQPLAGSVIIETPVDQDVHTSADVPSSTTEDHTDRTSAASANDEEHAAVPLSAGQVPAGRKRRLPFRTHDFGGALVERGDSGVPELTDEFNRWLETADCLLFFLAADQLQDPQQAEQRLVEVDAVLFRLIEKGPTGHFVSQPIAVLITKWDLVSDLTGSPDEEYQKLLSFLAERGGERGKTICKKIQDVGDQVKVYPVSTFGGHVDGRPVHPLKPFNLHEPLVWALQRTDWSLYAKTRRQAEQALAKRRWRFWTDYASAIRAYQRLVDDYGIWKGPVYDRIQADLAPLQAKHRRRTVRAMSVCGLTLLAAVAYGSYHLDRSRYIGLTAKLEAPRDPYSELDKQVAQYLKSHNPWASFCGRKRHIRVRWADYTERMQAAFAKLQDLHRQPPPETVQEHLDHASRCAKSFQDFLEQYPASPGESLVKSWLVEVQQDLTELRFAQNVESLAKQWDNGPQRPDDARELLAEAQKLTVPTSARIPITSKSIQDLYSLIRELKSFLGDLDAQSEKYLSQIDNWLTRCKSALASDHPDLPLLNSLQSEAQSLQHSPVPNTEQCRQSQREFARLFQQLEQAVRDYTATLNTWVARAETAASAAENYLHDSQSQDVSELERAAAELTNLLDEERLPNHPQIPPLRDKLRSLQAQLQREIERYRRFDAALTALESNLSIMEPDDQRSEILKFLRTHPSVDFLRRQQQFQQLEDRLRQLGGDIDAARFAAVQNTFQEFEQRAKAFTQRSPRSDVLHHAEIEGVRDAFDAFQSSAVQYTRQTDPAPQHIDDVRRLQIQSARLLDDAEWARVRHFAKENQKDFDEIARWAKRYLDGDDRLPAGQRKHVEEAQVMIRQALSNRWTELYAAFYERATKMTTLHELKEAQNKAEELLDWITTQSNGPLSSFMPKTEAFQRARKQVDEWLKWKNDKLPARQPRNVTVTIDITRVGDRKVWVKATIDRVPVPIVMDGTTYSDGESDWFETPKSLQLEVPARDFSRQSSRLGLEITIDNYFGDTTSTVAFELPMALFMADSALQEFEFPDWKGKKATVKIECPELTPPPLDKPE